jgi:hypothetical protein
MVEYRPLAVQDLVGRCGIRTIGQVPAPRANTSADSDPSKGLTDTIRMSDRPCLDRCGDAIAHRLEQGESGRQFVVVTGVGAMDRDSPVEDRLFGDKVVGNARSDESITGEVLVSIDEPGGHEAFGSAESLDVPVTFSDCGPMTDLGDPSCPYDDCSVRPDRPVGVHAEQSSGDDQIGHGAFLLLRP